MPIYQLVLPSMGESVSEATITQWLKKVGDSVSADEAVVEVATDKVDSEVASEYGGVIKEILHPVNAVVAVDAPLVLIETDADVQQVIAPNATDQLEDTSDSTPIVETPEPSAPVEVAEAYMQQAQEIVSTPKVGTSHEKRFYSPLVKSIASEEHISESELDLIPGTGKDGRVTKRDILNFIKEPKTVESTAATMPKMADNNVEVKTKPTNTAEGVVPMTRMEHMKN